MQIESHQRRVLEERLKAKQRQVADRLVSLKGELTASPLTQLARQKPVVAAAGALVAGILVGLYFRSRKRSSSIAASDALTDLVVEALADRLPQGNGSPSGREELRSAVGTRIALAREAAAAERAPSFLGQLGGLLGRNLLMEGLGFLLTRMLDNRLNAEDRGDGGRDFTQKPSPQD